MVLTIINFAFFGYQCLAQNYAKLSAAKSQQDFKPRIHISESDFATITMDGKLCNSSGKLGAEQFETVFRRLLKLYTQRQVYAF